MKHLPCNMESEAYMAYQPFYIMNTQSQEENWEELEEKDWNYIKGIYPQTAKVIQEKVEDECDKLEYDGSMMFDEYPDKLMMRTICDRIYKEMQGEKEDSMPYAEDEEEENGAEVYPANGNSSVEADTVQGSQWFSSGQRRPPSGGPGFPPPPPPGPGWGPRPPQGGPGFPPPPPPGPGWGPRPPQGGPGFPPPPPPGPGWGPRPPQPGPGWISPRPPKRQCSCPPGRPCRDCLVALQTQSDWMRDMIEVLLYQEMMHRRNRRRRRRQSQRM
ncbi:MAG: hypothetical protein OSJ62_16025 [Lachnospiraceae bacterium]|nr:hypothetical protein [Lachnospiraceae bacterium]